MPEKLLKNILDVKKLEIAVGFTVLCASLAVLLIQSMRGNLLLSIVFGGCSWLGYITVHKSDTGKLLDTRDVIEEHIHDKTESDFGHDRKKAVIGALFFVLGAIIISQGVFIESYLITFLGTSNVIGGYAIFHYFMEGELF